jgi:SAM-dependent methyltransferase
MVEELLWEILRYLKRKKVRVDFNSLATAKPVSPVFGFDRGTPVDRHYVEKFLESRAGLIQGRVLEIGDSHYSRRFGGGRVEAYEVLHATPNNKGATIIGDLCDTATLPENAIDCFVCTQTFNFIYDVQKAVQSAHYLLKPGGVLLATVAGISQISRYDMERWGDYWRFTTASLQKLFEPLFTGGVEIESFGNVMAACAFLQGVSLEDLPDRALLDENDPDYQLIIGIVARKAP